VGWANSEKTKGKGKKIKLRKQKRDHAITGDETSKTDTTVLHTGTKALSHATQDVRLTFLCEIAMQRSDNGPDHGGGFMHLIAILARTVPRSASITHVRVLAPYAPIGSKGPPSPAPPTDTYPWTDQRRGGEGALPQSRARGNALGGQGMTVLGGRR